MIGKVGKVSAVIFDLDDTLYPHKTFVQEAYKVVSKRFMEETGLKDESFYDEILSLYNERGEKDRNIFSDALKKRKVYSAEIENALVAAYRSYRPPTLELFEGVRERLEMLKKYKLKLGLLTNGQSGTQRGKIAALKIEPYFDEIVISSEFSPTIAKPESVIFEYILKKLNCSASEAIMIGNDPETDIAGAVSAKIFPIFVRQGFYKNASISYEVLEFNSINEAVDFVLKIVNKG